MKNWKPPLPVDKWYAHMPGFRWLLRKNSRKRAGMSEKIDAVELDKDDEFTWRYAPLEVRAGGQVLYHVCEEYPGMGYTDPETPMGESMEELISELEMMLKDMKDAYAAGHVIVQGANYDNWRTRQLEKEPSIPWDEYDLGTAPTETKGEPYEDK